jgi:flagellar P-ring protein precursor FlgI
MKVAYLFMLLALTALNFCAPVARIKDIARLDGVRKNQLIGTGLVIGLNGTGDKGTLTQDMIFNILQNLGMKPSQMKVSPNNAAAVIITADLPAFTSPGDTIDVTVSTMGEAKSLQGGILLQTPLRAADGKVYAVAQGSLSIGGIAGGGMGNNNAGNHPTVAKIPGGAIVENEVATSFMKNSQISWLLKNRDFTTANRIAEIINQKFGDECAKALDAAKISVHVPYSFQDNPVEFVSLVGNLQVLVDQKARVVINERTGTVVFGGNVLISPIAVAHGSLIIQVGNKLNQTGQNEQIVEVNQGSTVQQLVQTLNLMGIKTNQLIAILQEIKNTGALQADLELM